MAKPEPLYRTSGESQRLQKRCVKAQQDWLSLAHQKRYVERRGVMGEVGDREILEMAEARVLAHNFKDKGWLEMALKVSERIYGKGSGLRIKAHMRVIWKEEMCK